MPNEVQPSAPMISVQRRYIHSDIYDRLVKGDENDLIALIAYGLYQRRKRRWLDNFDRDYGKTPSEDEVRAYCYGYDEGVLSDLRAQAERLIVNLTFKYALQNPLKDDVLRSVVKTELDRVHRRLTEMSGLRHAVVAHWLGFFSLVAAAALLFFAIEYEPTLVQALNALHIGNLGDFVHHAQGGGAAQ